MAGIENRTVRDFHAMIVAWLSVAAAHLSDWWVTGADHGRRRWYVHAEIVLPFSPEDQARLEADFHDGPRAEYHQERRSSVVGNLRCRSTQLSFISGTDEGAPMVPRHVPMSVVRQDLPPWDQAYVGMGIGEGKMRFQRFIAGLGGVVVRWSDPLPDFAKWKIHMQVGFELPFEADEVFVAAHGDGPRERLLDESQRMRIWEIPQANVGVQTGQDLMTPHHFIPHEILRIRRERRAAGRHPMRRAEWRACMRERARRQTRGEPPDQFCRPV